MSRSNKMEAARSELLSDVADRAASILETTYGLSPINATNAGLAIADDIAENWGGSQFCIPKDMKRKWQERREAIYSEFTGSNHMELAMKYGISTRAVYKILKRKADGAGAHG